MTAKSFIESSFPVKEVSEESARERTSAMDISQRSTSGGQEDLFLPELLSMPRSP